MFVIYLLFPAIINGFFMYQHLLLSMMILCICSFNTERKEEYLKIKSGEKKHGAKYRKRYCSYI
jgi:hypothetical protein